MGWLRNLPIYQKMIVIILVASCIALTATVGALLFYELTSFQPRQKAQARAQADLFSVNLRAPLLFDNLEETEEALQGLASNEAIVLACVYRYSDLERQETFYARWMRPPLEAECPARLTHGVRFEGGLLHLSRPIEEDGNVLGRLYICFQLPSLGHRLLKYLLMVGAVFFALVSLATVLSLALRQTISGPLEELVEALNRVAREQDYSVRVEPQSGDEIGNLTLAFNAMLETIEQRETALRQATSEQKKLQEQLVQSQKMESIGRLAGGVAHDFNNLLTVIVGCTDLGFNRLPKDSPVRPLLLNIRNATAQATGLTNRLLAFARRQVNEPRVLDLNELVLEAEKMLRTLIGDDVELIAIPRNDLWFVRADQSQMMQVLVNLAVNARDAMPDGGQLTIETENRDLGRDEALEHPEARPGEYVMVSVSDTGEGIDKSVQNHLFEPFFTTKERGKGTGLGLAMCYGIVKQSGGFIDFESRLGHGTVFRVFVPRTREQPEPTRHPKELVQLPSGEETLMVVEDNALVRVTTVELLKAQGYTVFEAASGPDALRLLDDIPGSLDLLVTDVVMPEMNGKEVARQIQAQRPDIGILYVSGYTANEIIHRGALEGGIAFLQKPYTSEALIRKVRSVLDQR